MRGAIICDDYDDDDEEQCEQSPRSGDFLTACMAEGRRGEVMNEKGGRSFPYRRTLTDT